MGFKREELKEAHRIVIKVGTSTLTYETGKINFTRIDKLARIISDLSNQGKEVVLVSSGAIGVGVDKLKLPERPDLTSQAWKDSLDIASNMSTVANPVGTCLYFVTNSLYAADTVPNNDGEMYTFYGVINILLFWKRR